MAPKVSVVLAVFNGERHLDAAVHSVLGQTFNDFELIVVDDGSTDGTPERLSALARSDPRVVVVRQPHRGLAASLNTGIALAAGAYIARQDADDVSPAERFARQVEHLDANPSVAALGTGADVIDGTDTVVGKLTVVQGVDAVKQGLLTLRTTPVHGSMMIRKSALDSTNAYRDAFRAGQDYDLWLRLSARYEIDNLPDVRYRWRLGAGGVYATRRVMQLKYAGIARVFARERADTGRDSYDLLERCGGDLDAFVDQYRLAPFVHAIWGELLLRGVGNSAQVRRHFRRALAGGCVRPWIVALCGWTHLGLPWPGGRPLTLAEGTEAS